MDRRERYSDLQESVRMALDGRQSEIWTAMPGIVQAFDAGALTATVQVAIQGSFLSQAGATTYVNIPPLLDCPVVFPRGGGFTLTFPVAAGDECLVVFASRCINSWWSLGGTQRPEEIRLHDLSDGFVLPGPFSQATKIAAVSTTTAQLRSDDGSLYIELARGGIANVVAPGGLNITGPVTVSGTITATGDIVGESVSLHGHVHGGVQTGSGNTGPPA